MRTAPLLRTLCLALLVTSAAAGAPARGYPVRVVSLPANDLVYDPVTQKIYASIPGAVANIGNTITAIDPETGQIGPSVPLGSEPGKLVIASEGRTIYASLDGAAAVRPFDTVTGTAGLQFSLGNGYGPNYADDLAVVPGHPDRVAISLYNRGISPNGVGVFIFENGAPLPKFVKGVNSLAYSDRPDRLYGYDNQSTGFGFLRMHADDTGIPGGDWLVLMTGFGVRIQFDGGRVYDTSGGVWGPEAGKLLGHLPGGLIRPDSRLGRVFLLEGDGANVQLEAYDASAFNRLWSAKIAGVSGGVGSLIRWGADGLAFRTSGGQIFLLHTGEINAPPTDFILTLNPTAASGEATVLGTLSLPAPAPPGGVTALLASSDPAAATVPPQVIVPAGAATAAFPVQAHPVAAAADVRISAAVGGITRSAALHLVPPPAPLPPAVAPGAVQLALFPNPVPGGLLALGQVVLPLPAGASGVPVTLTSGSPTVAVVPAAITVLPGASAATFPIVTFPVAQPTAVAITAGGAFGPATATLQVLPLTAAPPSPPPASGVRLLVSSHNSNSILRFDGQTGAFIDTFVAPGSGGLEGPHGLAIGPDGNLYVANRFHRSVLRFSGQTGAFLDAFVPPGSGGLDIPIGLVFGLDGDLYVSSYGTDEILHYDGRTGAFLDAFVPARAAGLTQPYALTFGPDGHLYAGSQGRNSIFRFDGGTGTFLDQFVAPGSGGLNGPNGLTFGPDGNLYVSSGQTHSVLRYDGRTGAFLDVFVPPHSGGLTEPWDLKFGPDGNLYVASAGSDQVLRYDGRTGAFLGAFAAGGGLSRPDWLLFVPSPPGIAPLLAAPANLSARFVPGTGLQLTWQNNSSNEDAVEVWRRTDHTDWTRTAVLVPHTATFLDRAVASGVTYTYRIRVTRGRAASAWSNRVSVAASILVNGLSVVTSGPQETLTATFTQPDGGVTVNTYQGYVLLHVTGVGQSYGSVYNDAFYLYTGPFNPPQNGHDGGYYQLAFGTRPLQAFDAGNDARNFLVGPLPPYNPAHDYTFVLNTGLASPGFLHFGVSDGGFNDNTGAYVITVSQLGPLP